MLARLSARVGSRTRRPAVAGCVCAGWSGAVGSSRVSSGTGSVVRRGGIAIARGRAVSASARAGRLQEAARGGEELAVVEGLKAGELLVGIQPVQTHDLHHPAATAVLDRLTPLLGGEVRQLQPLLGAHAHGVQNAIGGSPAALGLGQGE